MGNAERQVKMLALHSMQVVLIFDWTTELPKELMIIIIFMRLEVN